MGSSKDIVNSIHVISCWWNVICSLLLIDIDLNRKDVKVDASP